MSNVTSTEPTVRQPSLPVRGAVAVTLSVLLNAALVLLVSTLGVAPGFQPLTIPPVVFLSAVGAAGATGVYWLLRRRVDDADRTFVRVAAVVLALSYLPDVGLLFADPAATVVGVGVLMVMHVVVAAASVGTLVFWTGTR
ncbi:hypothetical protein JCM30237_14280 [Halolamina litorea]|uniref:DUF6069 family protein n=1 Tax=Halolamina litorea TaxID=1515593 RepID=A0ABD6BNN6_9EURY|nr:DUF6069 family protein [Halolamina litorea]